MLTSSNIFNLSIYFSKDSSRSDKRKLINFSIFYSHLLFISMSISILSLKVISYIEILSHKLIASDRKSNSIHQCVCMHVKKRPIQSVSVSDNVLNIARQITECLPLVNCLLWLPASVHRLFFLQLVKSAIHTMMNQDQRTHTPYMY